MIFAFTFLIYAAAYAYAKSIQLVRVASDNLTLEAVPSTLKYLRSIPAPVGVVTIVGEIHSGKSYMLNQLMAPFLKTGENEYPFTLGYSTDPQTQGIWINEDVADFKGTRLLFLDTEGLFSKTVSVNKDARLFSIAALMANELIYNTVKFINTQQLDALETLMRRTILFGLRTYAKRQTGPSAQSVSSFLDFLQLLIPKSLAWVVQDFVQDFENKTPEAWLHQLLFSKATSPNSSESQEKALTRSLFENVECVPLSVPVKDTAKLQRLDQLSAEEVSEEYLSQIKNYRRRLFERLHRDPKKKFSSVPNQIVPMSGSDLADLLLFLIKAINASRLGSSSASEQDYPELPSIAHQFSELQHNLLRSDVLSIFKRDLYSRFSNRTGSDVLMTTSDLEKAIVSSRNQAYKLWRSAIRGIGENEITSSMLSESERYFDAELEKVISQLRVDHCKYVSDWCQRYSNALLSEFTAEVNSKERLIADPSELSQKLEQLAEPYVNKFMMGMPEPRLDPCCGTYSQLLGDRLEKVIKEHVERNTQSILSELQRIVTNVTERFDEELAALIVKNNQLDIVELQNLLSGLVQAKLALYLDKSRLYSEIGMRQSLYNELRTSFEQKKQEAIHEWEIACAEASKSMIKSIQAYCKSDLTNLVAMPCDEELLEEKVSTFVNAKETEFKNRFLCYDTTLGSMRLQELQLELANCVAWIRAQNIQSVKNLYSHVLDNIRPFLIESAHNFWLSGSYKQFAKRYALAALSDDKYLKLSDTQSRQHRNSLFAKVVDLFVNDLHLAFESINSKLFVRLFALFSMFLLVYRTIISRNQKGSLRLLFARSLLVIPLCMMFLYVELISIALRLLPFAGWLQSQSAISITLIAAIAAFLSVLIAETQLRKLFKIRSDYSYLSLDDKYCNSIGAQNIFPSRSHESIFRPTDESRVTSRRFSQPA